VVELRPEYVKIDMHFIQGINHDPVKLQFVRSIQEIAEKSNTRVIAEGIETQAELLVLRDVGVALGQGYHLGRPHPTPARAAPAEVVNAGAQRRGGLPAARRRQAGHHLQAAARGAGGAASMNNNEVYEIFQRNRSC
jgi:predicted signal transduction protein with EAL and GGDEF domain